MGNAEMGALV